MDQPVRPMFFVAGARANDVSRNIEVQVSKILCSGTTRLPGTHVPRVKKYVRNRFFRFASKRHGVVPSRACLSLCLKLCLCVYTSMYRRVCASLTV